MLWYGSAYYPEHWPESRWGTDARLMREAGFNVVRLGEFAWAKMEPAEDRFDFDWLDRVIGILQDEGIAVLLGTPTAGPPAWLVNYEDPERDCRMEYEQGGRWQFGGRSLCCVNHPRFIARSARIARAMGEHFARNKAVMGWQLDNEIGMYGTRCHCATCLQKFRAWMQAKYGSIQAVNERLGTIFGGGLFRDFSDIPFPRLGQDLHNPGLIMDSQRFVCDSHTAYLNAQVAALRGAGVVQPITTNVCHMANSATCLDENALFKNLDVAAWDCYPVQFARDPAAATMGLLHSMARGYKRKPYWMLEMQSGSPYGAPADDVRRIRLWAWQAIAHGAELILFFRWRTCRFGGEQYWRGILDHDARPNPRYAIVAGMGAEVKRLGPALEGLKRANTVAILMDHDAGVSFHANHYYARLNYRNHVESFFSALQKLHLGADVVYAPPQPGQYRLLIVPALRLIDEDWAQRLRRYVEAGGTLVASVCTATLNRDHVAPAEPVPWQLTDVFGVKRVEWSALSGLALPPKERRGEDAAAWKHLATASSVPVIAMKGKLAGHYSADTWCDHLQTEGAEVLARFAAGSPAGNAPAITRHVFGKGQAVYVAACLEPALNMKLLEMLLGKPTGIPTCPDDRVEIVGCERGARRVFFALNHGPAPATVKLPRPLPARQRRAVTGKPASARNLITAKAVGTSLTLDAYDVAILELT